MSDIGYIEGKSLWLEGERIGYATVVILILAGVAIGIGLSIIRGMI